MSFLFWVLKTSWLQPVKDRKSGSAHVEEAPVASEKLKLLRYRGLWFFFFSIKNLHHSKLLVGYAQYAHVPAWRQAFLNSLYMYFGIFHTGAVAQVGAELKHGEPVFQHFFSELRIVFTVLLGFGG